MKALLALIFASQAAFCADYLTGQAARLNIGQRNFTTFLPPSPSVGYEGVLGGVAGVAYGNNNLFIADSNKSGQSPVNNRVLKYTPVSGLPGLFNVPYSITFAPACGICVGNPAVVLGQPDLDSSTEALSQSGLRTPSAVATDGTVLAVADTDNNRVLIWNSIPLTNDQNADVVVGQPDFTHAGVAAPPTSSSLLGPQGVWIANGMLFVADTLNNRVLIYNKIPSSNGAAADIVIGAADFTTLIPPPVTEQVVPATQTNLSSPTSVTTDATHLYVSDLGHNRVLIWSPIPTSNNATASVVIGQPDFVSETVNNSSVLCPSNGTDTSVTPNVPTYPALCGNTLQFPRSALSDGQRLYVSDGGNDRVLVFNSIPSTNGAHADVILGEPDENTDAPSADADSMQEPSGLAWDGTNLYVADTYNWRVDVYTPLGSGLPLTGVRNAASLQIFASAEVTFSGTPAAKDVITVTVGTVNYAYTVQTNDTLVNVVNGIAALINGSVSGTAADMNVTALADVVNPTVFITARVPGTAGVGTALSTTVSSGSTVIATDSMPTTVINQASAVQIAPGSLVSIFGSGLSDQTAAFDYSTPFAPLVLGGTSVYMDGILIPLLFVSPTQVNAQVPFQFADRSSVSVYVVNSHGGGVPTATDAIGFGIVPQNPGLFAASGNEPRVGIVNHLSAYSSGLVSVDGTITAGNTFAITVGTNTYTYTVTATDTLATVVSGLVALLASDPLVNATPTNIYNRIFLTAKVPGTAGNAIAFSATASTSATIIATALSKNGFLCCGNSANAPVTADNPAVPGETLYTYATGLGLTAAPSGGTPDSVTGQLAPVNVNPLAYPVDSIVAGGSTANVVQASLVPGALGLYQVAFQISASLPSDSLTQLTIAQNFFVSNIVTFAVAVP